MNFFSTSLQLRLVVAATSLLLWLTGGVALAQPQYCQPPQTNGCDNTQIIVSLSISSNNFQLQRPTCNGQTFPYFAPPAAGNMLLRLDTGQTYFVTWVNNWTFNSLGYVGWLYLDWDLNGSFSQNESIRIGSAFPNGTANAQFTVPSNAVPGLRIARIRFFDATTFQPTACTTNASGSTHDFYCLVGAPGAGCATPPVANIGPAIRELCATDSVRLVGQANWTTSDLVFNWQQSADGQNWVPALGQNTGLAYTVKGQNIGTGTYYRMLAICPNGNLTPSNSTEVRPKSGASCYCIPSVASACQDAFLLQTIRTNNGWQINPPRACSGSNYFNLQNAGDTLRMSRGATVTITGNMNNLRENAYQLWVDYNQNGLLENGEAHGLSDALNPQFNTGFTSSFQVPATAQLGVARARLIAATTRGLGWSGACGSYTNAQTIDFLAKIGPAGSCILQAPLVSADSSFICLGSSTTVRAADRSQLTPGVSFVWQSSTDGGTTWVNLRNGADTNATAVINGQLLGNGTLLVRHLVTCPAGNSVASNVVTIRKSPTPERCYCAVNTSSCLNSQLLRYIKATGTNSLDITVPTGCSPTGYFYFRGSVNDTLMVDAATQATFELSFGNVTTRMSASLWIDYNQDGDFGTTEWTDLGRQANANAPFVRFVTIPGTARNGTTRARIRTREVGLSNTSADACRTFMPGNTYDFPVKIRSSVGLAKSQNLITTLFPNPATNTLHLGLVTEYPAVSFQLRDMTGKLIATPPATSHGADFELDLGSVTPGIYQLVVQAGQGVELQTVRKVVVQR